MEKAHCDRLNNDIHIPTSGTCEYVTSHGKREFLDMIWIKNFEMRVLSWVIWVGPTKSQWCL